MKLTFANDRLLAVMAHPDDAELLCAGTLGRGKADGAAVAIAVMCRGDKGAARSDSGDARSDLGRIRHEEAAAAAELLGARLFWLGAADGELSDTVAERQKLVEVMRQFRPSLVIAHAPEDYHPDHRASSAIAEAATWFCASRGHGTDSPALDAPPLDVPPVLWFADTVNASGFAPGFFFDVSGQLELKRRMLACHRSQLARGDDADLGPLPELMVRQCTARGAQTGVAAAEAFRWHHAFKRTGAF